MYVCFAPVCMSYNKWPLLLPLTIALKWGVVVWWAYLSCKNEISLTAPRVDGWKQPFATIFSSSILYLEHTRVKKAASKLAWRKAGAAKAGAAKAGAAAMIWFVSGTSYGLRERIRRFDLKAIKWSMPSMKDMERKLEYVCALFKNEAGYIIE